MAVTKLSDALAALRAQRDTIEAANPTPDADAKARLRAIRRTIRQLRDEPSETEEADELKDAFQECRDMEATPALFNKEQWDESAYIVVSRRWSLADDDPDPAVIDQKKIKQLFKRVAENVATELDPVRVQATEWGERFFGTYVDSRPIDTVFAADIATLEGAEMDTATLATTLADLESNQSRLKPRPVA